MKWLLSLSALTGFLAVALGAFGAHGLENVLSDEAKDWWQTATLYALTHSAAALACALSGRVGLVRIACGLFVLGVVVFSGSLYALALSEIRILGAITPLGGLAFLAGWGCLLVAGFRSKPAD